MEFPGFAVASLSTARVIVSVHPANWCNVGQDETLYYIAQILSQWVINLTIICGVTAVSASVMRALKDSCVEVVLFNKRVNSSVRHIQVVPLNV